MASPPKLQRARISTINTLASSNDGETTPAQTTIETLEWHAPILVHVDEHTTTLYLLKKHVQRGVTRPSTLRKIGVGDMWCSITARELYDEVQSVAAGLIMRDLEPRSRVVIMSRTRYEWTLLNFACWAVVLVPVPIYGTGSIDQVVHILDDADVRLIIIGTVSMAEIIRVAAQREHRTDTDVPPLDSGAVKTLIAEGATTPRSRVAIRADALTKDDIAAIVYISDTTGIPKRTVLSHENFANLYPNVHTWMPEVAAGRDSCLLLFLPLTHVSTRFLQVFQISGNGVPGHTFNIKNLLDDLASFKSSYLLVVPRMLERIYSSASTKVSGPKRRIFRWAAKVAVAYPRALDIGEGPSAPLKAQHAFVDRLIYQRIIRLMSGDADYVVSDGAPLAIWLAHFYRGVSIPALEGYGLTEAIGPVSVNTPRLSKIRTVGPALPSTFSKISDEGEILLKGPSVFQRYHNDPGVTAACFTEDGWSHTGGLGPLDRDDYVSITGRAKEIIVTAGGKNVAPVALENLMCSHPLISQALVVGDQRPFVAAFITLGAEILPNWLAAHLPPPMGVAETVTSVEVLASSEKAAASVNEHVSHTESIRKTRVLMIDFMEANGLLAPFLKVKHLEATRHLTLIIDEIYGGPVQD